MQITVTMQIDIDSKTIQKSASDPADDPMGPLNVRDANEFCP